MKKITEQLKIVASITKYSMLMYFRDKSAVFFSLFIPILIMSIFGVLDFGGDVNVQVGVVDLAKNQASVQMIEQLKKIDVLSVTEGDRDNELAQLKDSDRDIVMVLPTNFGANLGGQKVSPSPTTQEIELYYDQNKTNGDVQIGSTVIEKVFDQFTHQLTGTPELFRLERKSFETRELGYVDFLIPGIIAMSIMNMGIMGVVGAITSWRERGILKRLLATPIKPSSIIFGQVSTRLIIAIGQVVVLLALGILVFDLNVVGSLASVFVLTALGAIIFLSMGLAASGMAKTQNSVMAIGQLISMPQMFLSGIFFPLESMPEWLSNITKYLPLAYLANGMREVMIYGKSLMEVRTDIIGLCVWGIICFFVASRFFKFE